MKVTQSVASDPGPAEWFTGPVWMERIATPPVPARAQVTLVHFAPGARTAWHTHPFGQTLYILEGSGRVQAEGGPVDTVRAGDCVWFEPGERHWHGASPDSLMSHIAVQERDESGDATFWAEHVSDAHYDG
jgi:quercetin dioxygenase-like cupin family protein